MSRSTLALLALIPVLSVTAGCVNRAQQEQSKATQAVITDPAVPVSIAKVQTQTVQETFEITGNVTTADDTQVSARQFGRVAQVYVKDGDAVTAGQVIAQLDPTPLRAQYQQALAQYQTAQAAVSTAVGNLRYGPLKSSASVRQARAQLLSAKATLDKTVTGARPEERAQAEANLAAAKTNLQIAKTDLARKQALVEQGALAKNNLDQAQNVYASALQQYNNALQAQLILERGSRSEDIAVAREGVAEAQDQLTNAQAAKKLDVLYNDAVNSAKAQLEAAKSQLDLAKSNLDDATIKAPFSGRVSGKPVQPGTVLPAGTSIVRVIGGEGAYFEGQVPQERYKDVQVGTKIEVHIDALPGQTFEGTVAAINPLGVEIGRLFKVRIVFAGNLGLLKPNMFARGSVVSHRVPNATVVPTTAVVTKGQQPSVFVVKDGKAHAIPVKTGIRLESVIQVIGVDAGTEVVVAGQESLEEGTIVKIKSNEAVASTGTAGLSPAAVPQGS
jgi:RND family efflux transporter MFP subunit